jgi:hypothetical protein
MFAHTLSQIRIPDAPIFSEKCGLKGELREEGKIPALPEPQEDSEFSLPSLSIWQLATIDVFVEKAQYFLTKRINEHEYFALFSTVATLVVMIFAVGFGLAAFDQSHFFQWVFDILPPPPANGAIGNNTAQSSGDWTAFFKFFGNTTLLGLLLGIAYFFTSMTRAFLHEATTLNHPRDRRSTSPRLSRHST